jgi:hypothetical protein
MNLNGQGFQSEKGKARARFNLHALTIPLINLMSHFPFHWHIPANNTLKKERARSRTTTNAVARMLSSSEQMKMGIGAF